MITRGSLQSQSQMTLAQRGFRGTPWDEIFAWLRTLAETTAAGDYAIPGTNMTGIITQQPTDRRSLGIFECHRVKADVHFCLAGGEMILTMAPVANINVDYDREADVYFIDAPRKYTGLHELVLRPGEFLIIPANVPHLPRRHDGQHESVSKVVIKIDDDLLPPCFSEHHHSPTVV